MDKLDLRTIGTNYTILDRDTNNSSSIQVIDASELYPALAEAQRELVQAIANNWYDNGREQFKRIPKAIMPLLTAVSAAIASGSNSFALATIVRVSINSYIAKYTDLT